MLSGAMSGQNFAYQLFRRPQQDYMKYDGDPMQQPLPVSSSTGILMGASGTATAGARVRLLDKRCVMPLVCISARMRKRHGFGVQGMHAAA